MVLHAAPVALRSRPRVTVVIPHFNYGPYLPTAVRSALDQPDVDVDVIIVDDRSTDGSLETARALAATDDRIQLVEHVENMRHIRTYNDGLSRATGEFVVLLSADDSLSPGSLSRAVGLMTAHPSVGLVYGAVQTFEDVPPTAGGVAAWPGARQTWSVWSGEEWLDRLARTGRNLITNPEVVMRRALLADLGGYDSRFPHSADLYLWLRAAARADVGRVNGTVQGYYRVHGSNMHSSQFGGLLDDYSAVRSTYDTFFAEDGSRLARPGTLQQKARRAISREAIRRTVLIDRGNAPGACELLLDFSRETDPADEPARRLNSWLRRRGFSRQLRQIEGLRWRLRYRREIRTGR